MEQIADKTDAGLGARGIAALVSGFSLEATFPAGRELDALKRVVPPSTRVYLSCPPTHSPEQLVDHARAVRTAGLEPVPHLTARSFANRESLDTLLARLHREAGVRAVLVIAGDRDVPAGPFAGALELIESDALQRHGIREIGVAGYPDGHPKIDNAALARALPAKLEAAAQRNLQAHVVTQFCFEPDLILEWVRGLRRNGVSVPLRIGVAGPTSLRALLRFALRCGVRASMKGMLNPKLVQLLSEAAPDDILRALGEADDRAMLGPMAVHFFSFGGLARTAEWAVAAASGRTDAEPQTERVLR